jgi:hypothetical protein
MGSKVVVVAKPLPQGFGSISGDVVYYRSRQSFDPITTVMTMMTLEYIPPSRNMSMVSKCPRPTLVPVVFGEDDCLAINP